MKYLKLFEKFIEEPKFYRFNKFDLLGSEESLQLTPKYRKMVGPENINDVLVENEFPDKHKCIHFMDSLAFSPDYKGLYGDFIYEIQIDDESKLGWSFFFPVNDWFYKGYTFYYERNNPSIQDLLKSEYANLHYPYGDEQGDLDKMSEYLLEYEVIGTGTIEDLKNSKFFGNQKLFVWTNEDVIVKKWIEPKKQAKKPIPYKNKPLLTKEDFERLEVPSKKIADFYSSELGKNIRKFSDRLVVDPNKYDMFREEALRLLKDWNKNQINR
jgi:hypothetical protein